MRFCERCGALLFGEKRHGFIDGFVKNRSAGIRVCGDKRDCEDRASRGRTRPA